MELCTYFLHLRVKIQFFLWHTLFVWDKFAAQLKLYVIQVVDRAYNVIFPPSDLYTLSLQEKSIKAEARNVTYTQSSTWITITLWCIAFNFKNSNILGPFGNFSPTYNITVNLTLLVVPIVFNLTCVSCILLCRLKPFKKKVYGITSV